MAIEGGYIYLSSLLLSCHSHTGMALHLCYAFSTKQVWLLFGFYFGI